MRMASRIILSTAVAAASILGSAGVASARNICAGTYEIDGCEYCTSGTAGTAYDPYYCENSYSGYYWAGCNMWVLSNCIGGAIFN